MEQEPKREIWAVRTIIEATEDDARAAEEAIARTLCPDKDHEGVCPVPWSTVSSRLADVMDEEANDWREYFDAEKRVSPPKEIVRVIEDVFRLTGRRLDVAFPVVEDSVLCHARLATNSDEVASAMFAFPSADDDQEQLVSLVRLLQEQLLTKALGYWPPCPVHISHGLEPSVTNELGAAWTCPEGQAETVRIGALFPTTDDEAHRQLANLVQQMHATREPDEDLISTIGVGPLENLIRDQGETLWPEIERLARSDVRFRRALSFAWAYDSPEFERRSALLQELKEFWPVRVEFVATRRGFGDVPELGWRAVDVEPEMPSDQLAHILREIAVSAEREPQQDNPAWLRDKNVSGAALAWFQSLGKLKSAQHNFLHAASSEQIRGRERAAIEKAREEESQAWAELSIRLHQGGQE